MCVHRVSYSTVQFKTCHFLKSTVFNRESTWIDSTLLALLAHRSCKAEWQTRSLPHVKKCVVLFQYSFWSLIYLLHLKKITDRYVDSECLLTLVLWGLSKKDMFEKKAIFWKRKKNQKLDITQRVFFLKTCLKIIRQVSTADVASKRYFFLLFQLTKSTLRFSLTNESIIINCCIWSGDLGLTWTEVGHW